MGDMILGWGTKPKRTKDLPPEEWRAYHNAACKRSTMKAKQWANLRKLRPDEAFLKMITLLTEQEGYELEMSSERVNFIRTFVYEVFKDAKPKSNPVIPTEVVRLPESVPIPLSVPEAPRPQFIIKPVEPEPIRPIKRPSFQDTIPVVGNTSEKVPQKVDRQPYNDYEMLMMSYPPPRIAMTPHGHDDSF